MLLILLLILMGLLLYLMYKWMKGKKAQQSMIPMLPVPPSQYAREEYAMRYYQQLQYSQIAPYLPPQERVQKLIRVSQLAWFARNQIIRLLLPQNVIARKKSLLGGEIWYCVRTEDKPFLNMMPYILYKYYNERHTYETSEVTRKE